MKYVFLLILVCLTGIDALSQSLVRGKIISADSVVPAAAVSLGARGTLSSADGTFSFSDVIQGEYILSVSAVGFSKFKQKLNVSSDTVSVTIQLQKKDVRLNEVQVTAEREEIQVKDSTVRMEVYSGAFLKRNLPENLMQIVNSMNGVQEQLNCGVCNTSDIHINGLEGPNTLVLIDGMPVVSALSTVYGLNGIPSSIINRIEVTRGPSSAVYGTDAIAGTINVVTKSPVHAPRFEFNSFLSSQLERNSDLSYAHAADKFSIMGSLAWFDFDRNIDRNFDGFTDVARADRKTLLLKSAYHPTDRFSLNTGFRLYGEERWGGQLNWNNSFKGSDSVYGEWINTARAEAFASVFNNLNKVKLKTDVSAVSHNQESFYGTNSFNADQLTLFAASRVERPFSNHTLIAGFSQKYNKYQDNTSVSGYGTTFLPGVFLEDELRLLNGTLKLMPGGRIDYFNKHGFILSPRLNSNLKTGKYSRLQFSAGRGFRIVSVFTEDHAALTGSRKVVIAEKLDPESSWSSSATFSQTLAWPGSSNIEVTGFYTYFTNQIIPDYSAANYITYSNLNGYSVSQGASVNYSGTFKFPLRYSMGVTFIDAYELDEVTGRSEILFAPEYSVVSQLSYRFKRLDLELSYSSKLYGPMALPEFPEPFTRPPQSPVFSIHNIQLMKRYRGFEFTMSIKNVFDYMQSSPLIDPSRPFSDTFDTSYIYGPLQGRRAVLAVKYTLF